MHRRFQILRVLLLIVAAAVVAGAQAPTSPSKPNAAPALDSLVDRFVLDVATVTAGDLSADGHWLAGTTGSLRSRIGIDNTRFQDPTYVAPSLMDVWVADTTTGSTRNILPEKRQVRGLKWSPDANRLAFFLLNGDVFEPTVWTRLSGGTMPMSLPAGTEAAENAEFEWSLDGSEVFFAIRGKEWRTNARKRFSDETTASVIVHSSKEPFLSLDDVRRMAAQRRVIAYNIANGSVRDVVPEGRVSSYALTEDGTTLTVAEDITKKTDYDVIFGVDNQIQALPARGGAPKLVLKSTKGLTLQWSRDGRAYAYAKDGKVFTGTLTAGDPRQIAGPTAAAPADADGKDAETKDEQKFTVVRVSPTGDRVIASDKKGLWLVDGKSSAKELIVAMPEDDKEWPRYQVIDWSPDGSRLYLSYTSRKAWERGVSRYDIASKQMTDLVRDGKIYSNVRLSKDGKTFVFNAAEGNRPPDLFAADVDFTHVRRLTTANAAVASGPIAKTELVSYLDVDGKKLYGVLYYPVNYERGMRYPTVFEIYEDFFDDRFSGTINVLTQNGYAVMQPSVNLEIGHPGESWTKGVTAAANKLIDMGIADGDRLGVSGTSYGGYATALLITQTPRFKAAINISGKVDMISFYTDSPRLGVRNTHAPEKSQDRIGGTLWQQPMKYIQHSAVFAADRIKTPLLLMHGEQDHNVPFRQSMEMYYAMRRLGKDVKWVAYTHGGHGMPTSSVAEVYDYHRQIVSWWNEYLKSDVKKTGTQ